MGKILVIEDEEKLIRILKLQLEHQNYRVSVEKDGIDALNNIDRNRDYYDLITLDLTLPGMDGNKLCRQIRKISDTPIIVISARSSVEEKVELLKSGANDYVTKPFDIQELLARIEVNIRKNKVMEISYGDITINLENYEVRIKDKEVYFSKTEYHLLKLLVENSEKIVPREKIAEKIWGWETSDNLIDSTMKKLRHKIGKNTIKTVRGIGYKLEDEKNMENKG